MKTDAQLKKDVTAELEWDPAVNATHIGVAVQDGVVKKVVANKGESLTVDQMIVEFE